MEREELGAWLRLALTPGVGNGAARRLLAAFGLPTTIYQQSERALAHVVSAAQAQALASEPDGLAAQIDVTQHWLEASQADGARRVITLGDTSYPKALLAIADPPLMLYLEGDVERLWPDAIAVVGSRNPTPQGLVNAREFAASFARAGLTVVSGLALGVDGAAHEGALQAAPAGQLATIAVVGTGLDTVYPRRHLALWQRIAQAGLLVSEYPLGTPPLKENFPKRNRLISGLSQGTLVVEAALKSGSLITAGQALEQGREVFAIPGSIHSTQSRGCHALLKQGAKLVETAEDVLEELPSSRGSSRPGNASTQSQPRETTLQPQEDDLLVAMGFDPVSLDALVARTGSDAASLQARLMTLELQGELARLPGGLFQRMAAA